MPPRQPSTASRCARAAPMDRRSRRPLRGSSRSGGRCRLDRARSGHGLPANRLVRGRRRRPRRPPRRPPIGRAAALAPLEPCGSRRGRRPFLIGGRRERVGGHEGVGDAGGTAVTAMSRQRLVEADAASAPAVPPGAAAGRAAGGGGRARRSPSARSPRPVGGRRGAQPLVKSSCMSARQLGRTARCASGALGCRDQEDEVGGAVGGAEVDAGARRAKASDGDDGGGLACGIAMPWAGRSSPSARAPRRRRRAPRHRWRDPAGRPRAGERADDRRPCRCRAGRRASPALA